MTDSTMTKKKESDSSSDRKQWEKIFESLVEKLQIVSGERQFYRDRLISDTFLYKEFISQLESEKATLQMIQNVDRLKLEMIVSLKKRNDAVHNANYNSTANDLKDLKAAFDCVTKETNAITQIAALKSERDFIWNQYKTMEREYTGKLKSKNIEIGQANDKIMTLLKEMEQLRSSNIEKDSTIRKLKYDVGDFRATAVKSREEIDLLRKKAGSGSSNIEKDSTIRKLKSDVGDFRATAVKSREEIDLLRKKAGSGSAAPSLRGCTVVNSRMRDKGKGIDNGSATYSLRGSTVVDSRMRDKGKGIDDKNIVLKIEGNPSGLHEKETRSSKRKAANSTPITPKLFSSAFKVPKLKNPSPRLNI